MIRISRDLLYGEPDADWMLYEGKLFTGIAFELFPSGKLRAETTWHEGFPNGIQIEWYDNGQKKDEHQEKNGAYHGFFRDWHRSGKLKTDGLAEFGFVLRKTEWDEAGNIAREFVIDSSSPDYKSMEICRELDRKMSNTE